MFWKKKESVEQKLDLYFEKCDQSFETFQKAMQNFLDKGWGPEFRQGVDQTHQLESEADDIRRDIEYLLYGKALLPESRGDLLGLLEAFDRLPNITEAVVFVLYSQKVVLPKVILKDFETLLKINLEAYRAVRKAVDVLMTNPRATLHATAQVDLKESESDHIERALIFQIFDLDISMGEKMMLKEIVLLVGEISDRAQRVADRINLVAIKRNV